MSKATKVSLPLIMRGPATVEEQLQALKAYAYAKYDLGWDEVVECWDEEALKEEISGCKTCWGAIEKVGKGVNARAAYAKEIQSSWY